MASGCWRPFSAGPLLAGFIHYASIQAEKKKARQLQLIFKPVFSERLVSEIKMTEDQLSASPTKTETRDRVFETNMGQQSSRHPTSTFIKPTIRSLALWGKKKKPNFDGGTDDPTFTKPISAGFRLSAAPDAVYEPPPMQDQVRSKLSHFAPRGPFFPRTRLSPPPGERYSVTVPPRCVFGSSWKNGKPKATRNIFPPFEKKNET